METQKISQILTELRRSNAAGKHGKKRKDRRNEKRKAIAQSKEDG